MSTACASVVVRLR
jgi:hypothetical protein